MKIGTLHDKLFGAPLDPLNPRTRQHIALVAFLAWVGLGADGLSSSCYGPEEAFRALGNHTSLGLYLAIATALTVFIISLAYNQVIELFPSGGGGYKVATRLIGRHAGLISGSALILDYVLTIAISAASGMDALFSLLPPTALEFKLASTISLVVALVALNLRGMKESIQILLPIFLGFMLSHTFLILYGIGGQFDRLPGLLPHTITETTGLTREFGWVFVAALFLRAYSLGGGTYTGIEAVSNNVQSLAEPRVKTGKLTMLYMALSLSFTAGGIILLYLLWNAKPVEGQTLNAVLFGSILEHGWGKGVGTDVALWLVLAFEAALLFVGANTGFLGGPAVLANMAGDSWLPHQFRYLSTRLVTENGILLMGAAALAILVGTGGSVALLVVLYSINVFLTFSLSLAGLCIYWGRQRRSSDGHWRGRLALSALGLSVTFSILVVTLIEKFTEGGWVTVMITSVVIGIGLIVNKHYADAKLRIRKVDEIFANQPFGSIAVAPKPDPEKPTAAFLVGSSRGGGLYAVLWVQRMFADHFKNFVFISAGTVDSQSYGGAEDLKLMKMEANIALTYFVNFCNSIGRAAKSYLSFGTDPIDEVTKLAEQVQKEFPNCIFFTSKLIFERENWFMSLLHNQAALEIQRRLHLHGLQMVILPMKI
jgi:Amino acid permease